MINECKKIREILIDVFYGESRMDEEMEMHLKECVECRAFYESLHGLKDKISILDTAAMVDEQVIRQAFRIVDHRQKKRKERMEFAIFLLAAAAVLSIIVVSGALGYGMEIMACMLALTVLTSLIIPLVFIRSMLKGDT